MTNYDYIIIGAGSAGCVVANRLTEDSKTTVLLLEAGNPDTKLEIQIPAECLKLLGSEVDWGYFSEPEPYLNNRKIYCPRGKVLGGSSAINFMLYSRGNRHDYDHWQALGNPSALLSVSENHAQSKSLRAFPHNDLSGEFLIETQKCRSIGKTHALSGLQRMRSPRVTEER
jgi:choline dehydrogenase-like flavoprotein